MKVIERKMLSELIKNSRRSDRELAKAIGTSQPTATRIRSKLEKEGYIKEYTAVPNFNKVGYSILAMTFLKMDLKMTKEEYIKFKEIHFEAISKIPYTIFLMKTGMGLGYDAVIISLHPTYASCDRFRNALRDSMISNVSDVNTFLVNLEEEKNSMPFTFSILAEQVLRLSDKDEK